MDDYSFLSQYLTTIDAATKDSEDAAYVAIEKHIGKTDELDDHFVVYTGSHMIAVDFMYFYQDTHTTSPTRQRMGAAIRIYHANNTDWSNFALNTADAKKEDIAETRVFLPPHDVVNDYGDDCLEQFVKRSAFELALELAVD